MNIVVFNVNERNKICLGYLFVIFYSFIYLFIYFYFFILVKKIMNGHDNNYILKTIPLDWRW